MFLSNKYLKNFKILILDLAVFLTPLISILGIVSLAGGGKPAALSLVGIFVILFLPGFLGTRVLLKKNQNVLLSWLFSLGFSFIFWLYPCLLAYVARVPLDDLVIFGLLGCLILTFLSIRLVDSRTLLFGDIFKKESGLLLLVFAFFFLVALRRGSHEAGDALFHIAYIKHLASSINVSPYEVHFPISEVNPSSGYSIWYLVMAIVTKFAKQEAYTVWRTSVYIFAPLIPVALYVFAKAIFEKSKPAVISVFFFTVYYLINGLLFDVTTANYPDRIARLVLLPIVILLIQGLLREKYILKSKRIQLIAIALIAASLFSIHMFSWLFIFIFLFIFWVIDYLFYGRRSFKRLYLYLGMMLSILVASLPALLLKFEAVYQFSKHAMETAPPGVYSAVMKTKLGLLMVDPRYLNQGIVLFTLVALLSVKVYNIYSGKRGEYWYFYAWLIFALPILVMIIPPLATIVAKIFSQIYLLRLILFVPIFIVLGGIFAPFLRKKHLYIILCTLFLGILLLRKDTNILPKDLAKIDAAYQYINTEVPQGSIVASNLWDSYYLSAYSNNYIVANYKQHTSLLVNRDERIRDLTQILSIRYKGRKTRELIKKYNVEYILVRRKPPGSRGYRRYWKPELAIFGGVNAVKFEGYKEFNKIYEDEEYYLYQTNLANLK